MKLQNILPPILALMLLITACGEGGLGDTLGNAIKKDQQQNPNYTCDMLSNKMHSISYLMKINSENSEQIKEQSLDAYAANDYQLLWQSEKGRSVPKQTEDLLNMIRNAEKYGLDPKHYNTEVTDTLYNQIYQQNKFKDEQLLLNKIDLDLNLTSLALSFMSDLSNGRYTHKWDYPKGKTGELGLALGKAVRNGQVEAALKAAQPPSFLGYDAMQAKVNYCKKLKANGGLSKATSSGLSQGTANKASKALAQRLYIMGDYKGDVSGDVVYNDALVDALKAYQKRNGLSETGKLSGKTLEMLNMPLDELIQKLELNLERMRWLPDDMGQRFVFVNIPQYQIQVVDNDKEVMNMRAVVGDVKKPTPVFTEPMTHLVFSPIWNIPTSIAREEILKWLDIEPALLYVGDVVSYYKGKKITDPFSVDWKAAKKDWKNYSFKQKPTNQNSLGDVKFMFPNKYAVYLHDTPAKKYFNQDFRAMSAGCVRVQKPAEMAQYLLDDKEWTLEKVKRAMAGSREWRVNLKQDVPVYLYYLTCRADEQGRLSFFKDVYRHDQKQLKKMQ